MILRCKRLSLTGFVRTSNYFLGRPQFLGPDADSGIEDEDPNSPSATPSSATPSKPPSTLVGEHKLLSPLTSCNGFLDTIRAPTSAESYSMEGVVQHNLLRRIHDTPPLRHSLELQKMAQSYADYLAEARLTRFRIVQTIIWLKTQ